MIPYCIVTQDSTRACKVVDIWVGDRLDELNKALSHYDRGKNSKKGAIAPVEDDLDSADFLGKFTSNEKLKEAAKEWVQDKEKAKRKYGPIEDWDVSEVTSFYKLFEGAEEFNEDLSRWDVSNCTDTEDMFAGCSAFNSDLSLWNTSNCTDMGGMFYDCSAFNSDLSSWNMSKVEDTGSMFYKATAMKNSHKPKGVRKKFILF